MKKILFLCLLMVSIVLSAQIKLGEGSTATGNAPVNSGYFSSYSQQIFTKQEINTDAAGNITGLKFYVTSSANPFYQSTWDVYVGHTTKAAFAAYDTWIPSGQMAKVYSGNVYNVNGIIDVTFTTPFSYDNVRNLVIAVHEKGSNDNPANQFFVYATTLGGALYIGNPDYNDPASSLTGSSLPYKSVVTLKGLVPSVLPVCPVVSYPVDNTILVPTSPAITWNASQGATGYKVSIGTTPGGTDVVNQQSVATTSFTPSSPLSVYTTYYLSVKAVGLTGESSGCVTSKFTTAPLPPSNDECVNAVPLTVNPNLDCVNVTSGTTLLASVSGSIPNSCNASYSHNDVWYKFTATASRHMVRLLNSVSVGTVNDNAVYFEVFKGSCGNLSSVSCSDTGVLSIMSDLIPGETYYVKVYSIVGQGAAQNFDICVVTFPPAPSNDECNGAINLPVNPDLNCVNITNGTTASATNSSLLPNTCYNSPNNDVWFKFTATGIKHVITLSNIVSKVPGMYSPTLRFQVYKGSCNNLTSLSCSSQSTLIVNNLTAGDTYYVRVYSGMGGVSMAINFNICIKTVIPPPPPSNDEFANAVTLPVNPDLNCTVVTAGSTLGATVSNTSATMCGDVANPNDVWFKFTATAIGHLILVKDQVSLGVLPGTVTAFQVFKVDNGNLTSIQCIRGGAISVVGNVSGLTIGETYYIRVFNTGNDLAMGFNICIGTLPPHPVNDNCSGALAVSSYPYSYTQTDAIAATNNNGFITTCTPAINDGTWFTFTGDGSIHKILVTKSDNFDYYIDLKVGIYKGSCGNLTCVNAIYPTYLLFLPTVAGTVYYINVGNQSGTQDNIEGPFTITIQREGNGSLSTSEVSKTEESIEAYPNPFTEVLNISKADKVKSISILDSSGRLIRTIEKPSSVLQLRDLKEGMYLVVLNMKDGSKQTVKAIKK
ncbi:hypothetical protein DBR39_00335 [Chryseobacterium sp. KBW03]|uniref:T9SS type A sorting domain-containing protein n=1 Tax=Chryseobacterium sp. KBW03 TaxID=2153362 RepID=UPI000F5A6A1E|nr:T9SS type A sorting domain-containing protein [Chryseobacterium sp. KBW03]RQO42356.1 hypothetical protein DBR39_00335 [Chryseobacterium sp. KBW03]